MRVFITGIRGFTGRYLAAELARLGHEVLGAVDILERETLTLQIQSFQPHWVFHLAAKSFAGDHDQSKLDQINVQGTLNLLHALVQLKHRPLGVLIPSSATVYDSSQITSEPVREDFPLKPHHAYAKSKLAMEQVVLSMFDRLPLILVRPFNYTGVGQSIRFIIPKMIHHFSQRLSSIELGNILISREFMDVETVVQIYIALMRSSHRQVIVNVCQGRCYSLQSILESLSQMAGYTIEVVQHPDLVRRHEPSILQGDPTFLMKLIDVQHSPTSEDLMALLTKMYHHAKLRAVF